MTTVRSKSCEFVAQMAPYRRILCNHGIYNIMPKVGRSSMASTVLAIPVLSSSPERNLENGNIKIHCTLKPIWKWKAL